MQESQFIAYLLELRQRLLKILGALLVVFSLLFLISDKLFQWLALPLLHHLPQGNSLIATGVAAPLMAPLKFSMLVAIVLVIPYILFQLWGFIAPGLYAHERRLLWLALIPSVALFYLGMIFAYFVVFPLVFGFFVKVVPLGVMFMPDISQYLDFTIKLFLAFGFAFEVPVVTVLLVKSGIVSVSTLQQQRPYVIVLAFIIGMLLTPPDVISQILLAVPICILYEAGLLYARSTQTSPTTDLV